MDMVFPPLYRKEGTSRESFSGRADTPLGEDLLCGWAGINDLGAIRSTCRPCCQSAEGTTGRGTGWKAAGRDHPLSRTIRCSSTMCSYGSGRGGGGPPPKLFFFFFGGPVSIGNQEGLAAVLKPGSQPQVNIGCHPRAVTAGPPCRAATGVGTARARLRKEAVVCLEN